MTQNNKNELNQEALPWPKLKAEKYKKIANPSSPSGEVNMYFVDRIDTGETVCSLGVDAKADNGVFVAELINSFNSAQGIKGGIEGGIKGGIEAKSLPSEPVGGELENEANKNVGDLELKRKIGIALKNKWLGTHDIGANPGISWEEFGNIALSVIRQQSSVKVDDGVALESATIALLNKYRTYYEVEPGKTRQDFTDKDWKDANDSANKVITAYLKALRSSEMPNGSGKED